MVARALKGNSNLDQVSFRSPLQALGLKLLQAFGLKLLQALGLKLLQALGLKLSRRYHNGSAPPTEVR